MWIYNKEEQNYIYQQYEKFTGVLQTLFDYEHELQRALDEWRYIEGIIYDKNRGCYKIEYQNEFALLRFLSSRIKNCKIKINQLKQRR